MAIPLRRFTQDEGTKSNVLLFPKQENALLVPNMHFDIPDTQIVTKNAVYQYLQDTLDNLLIVETTMNAQLAPSKSIAPEVARELLKDVAGVVSVDVECEDVPVVLVTVDDSHDDTDVLLEAGRALRRKFGPATWYRVHVW